MCVDQESDSRPSSDVHHAASNTFSSCSTANRRNMGTNPQFAVSCTDMDGDIFDDEEEFHCCTASIASRSVNAHSSQQHNALLQATEASHLQAARMRDELPPTLEAKCHRDVPPDLRSTADHQISVPQNLASMRSDSGELWKFTSTDDLAMSALNSMNGCTQTPDRYSVQWPLRTVHQTSDSLDGQTVICPIPQSPSDTNPWMIPGLMVPKGIFPSAPSSS
eukprot:ANDGO_01158.mRNA.1 hypothetical protein